MITIRTRPIRRRTTTSSTAMRTRDHNHHLLEHVGASALTAGLTFPLWRATAVAQSGFGMVSPISRSVPAWLGPYLFALSPPYKGMVSTIFIMTWGRAAIFWGSDMASLLLQKHNYSNLVCTVVPPALVSTAVMCINMPIVRASVILQNPACHYRDVREALYHIYRAHGFTGLWTGTSASILKAVPKFTTAIIIKNYLESFLPQPDPTSPTLERDRLWRSAYKSSAAGVAGAVLTNPLDVVRNEMFKTEFGLIQATRHLHSSVGAKFLVRGLGSSIVATAVPIALTIFLTDTLIQRSVHLQQPHHAM